MSDEQPRGRPFPAGVSGNPGGRPKGLAKRIRLLIASQKAKPPAAGEAATADTDGWDLIALRLFKIAMGDTEAKERDQIAAAKLLYERADGHPRQNVKIEESAPVDSEIDWSKMTLEERRETLERFRKLGLAGPATDGGNTEH